MSKTTVDQLSANSKINNPTLIKQMKTETNHLLAIPSNLGALKKN
jgi:hypothetical protein